MSRPDTDPAVLPEEEVAAMATAIRKRLKRARANIRKAESMIAVSLPLVREYKRQLQELTGHPY